MPAGGSSEARAALGLSPAGVAAFLALHVVVWTVVATLANWSGTLHHDMTEAYDWGREFQLGYAKHPPVFAWVAGAWFAVFPRTDWAYYLLSALNAAGGLAGVWLTAGRLLTRPQQTAALLLTVLTPFFNTLAVTFNANAILLLVWPWTVYAFVRSIQSLRPADGALFGVAAAVAMGSKYSSILLLVSCLGAAALHPRAKAYFTSPAPYVAIAVAALLLAPHLAWAFGHRLTTVTYVFEKQHFSTISALRIAGASLIGSLAFIGLAAAAFGAIAGRNSANMVRRAMAAAGSPRLRWLTVLALAPSLLTVLAGLAVNIKVSTNFLIPAFFFIPIAAIAHSGVVVGAAQLVLLRRFVAGWFIAALVGAPVFAIVVFQRQSDLTTEPRAEIAAWATQAWQDAYHQPLKIAAGTAGYGLGLPFYSPDAPSLFDMFGPAATPWVTPERIASDGMLIVCQVADQACAAKAGELATPAGQHRAVRLAHTVLGWRSPEVGFDVFMRPPVTVGRKQP